MALPSTEIRYKRSTLLFIAGLFIFFVITGTFATFFSGATGGSPTVYLFYFTFVIILAFVSFRMYKRYSSPQPVLIFNSDGLHIPGKSHRYIRWGEITEWKIRTDKSSKFLVIRTAGDRTRIDISWLELPAKEIEQLMKRYIRQPGPHFSDN